MNGWEVSTILLSWVIVGVPVWWFIWGRRRSPQPSPELVVLCRDESSFGGVELRRDSAGILLAAARLLPDDGPPVQLEGDLWIPAANVRAVQIVTGHEALREPALGLRTERQGRG